MAGRPLAHHWQYFARSPDPSPQLPYCLRKPSNWIKCKQFCVIKHNKRKAPEHIRRAIVVAFCMGFRHNTSALKYYFIINWFICLEQVGNGFLSVFSHFNCWWDAMVSRYPISAVCALIWSVCWTVWTSFPIETDTHSHSQSHTHAKTRSIHGTVQVGRCHRATPQHIFY